VGFYARKLQLFTAFYSVLISLKYLWFLVHLGVLGLLPIDFYIG
jgi:hypothetical protein